MTDLFSDRPTSSFGERPTSSFEKGQSSTSTTPALPGLEVIRKKVIATVKDSSGKLLLMPDQTTLDSGGNVITQGRLDAQGNLAYPDDYDVFILAAVERYSRHRPNRMAVDTPGDGGHDYPMPEGWVDEFSVIEALEYPVGDVPATLLTEGDNEDYYLYLSPAGLMIRIITGTPSPSQTWRATITYPRTTETIARNDVSALCSLAASLCLEALANLFTQVSDPTIAAD